MAQAYATVEEMLRRVNERELLQLIDSDADALTEPEDRAKVETVLNDATAEMNGYIRVRHALPLAEIPPILPRLACTIGRFLLYKNGTPKDVKDAYDAAIQVLRDISKGVVVLSDPAGTPPPQSEVMVLSGGADRMFNQKSMKGF